MHADDDIARAGAMMIIFFTSLLAAIGSLSGSSFDGSGMVGTGGDERRGLFSTRVGGS